MNPPSVKTSFCSLITTNQKKIVDNFLQIDPALKHTYDIWKRPGGGGGTTCVIEKGEVFEKGGVNISIVEGFVTETMRNYLQIDGYQWFAAGLSIVIHPLNPFVPTIHANWRYFELYDQQSQTIDSWFGGGTDLTPYYFYKEDVVYFHQTLKKNLDRFDPTLYPKFKQQCDAYFVNKHRNNEARGVGGIFYDYLKTSPQEKKIDWLLFQKSNMDIFLDTYIPIVEKRTLQPYQTQHKEWQYIRRGRYAEFNLLYDKGTLFGLKTDGRVESILMSLPPMASWQYNFSPLPNSLEAEMLENLIPQNWVDK